MPDYAALLEYVSRYIQLTREEEDYFLSLLRYTKIRKRQFLVQPGYISKFKNYIVKGCFRVYIIDDNGVDHTVQISIEDWWINDFGSFINQEPATMFVEALEDSELIQIDFDALEALFVKVPKFDRLFRVITERAFIYSQQRIISNISQTAEERYLAYIDLYPEIANRVPQYMIASYLGMTTEFLSKIRKRIAEQ